MSHYKIKKIKKCRNYVFRPPPPPHTKCWTNILEVPNIRVSCGALLSTRDWCNTGNGTFFPRICLITPWCCSATSSINGNIGMMHILCTCQCKYPPPPSHPQDSDRGLWQQQLFFYIKNSRNIDLLVGDSVSSCYGGDSECFHGMVGILSVFMAWWEFRVFSWYGGNSEHVYGMVGFWVFLWLGGDSDFIAWWGFWVFSWHEGDSDCFHGMVGILTSWHGRDSDCFHAMMGILSIFMAWWRFWLHGMVGNLSVFIAWWGFWLFSWHGGGFWLHGIVGILTVFMAWWGFWATSWHGGDSECFHGMVGILIWKIVYQNSLGQPGRGLHSIHTNRCFYLYVLIN